MKIAVLILAAGKSSRMGAVKQLLKIDNKTIIKNAVENANNSKAMAVFCILGANATQIEKEIEHQQVEIIFNKNFESGLSSSIVAGVKFIEKHSLNFEAVLIMLADQPEVDYKYLNQLIEQQIASPQQIIASNYKGKAGVPAVFPKMYFNNLLQLSGDKGAKDLLLENKSTVITLNFKGTIKDIDTFKEYQSYLSNK